MRIKLPFAEYAIPYFFCFQLLFLFSCGNRADSLPWVESKGISIQLWVRDFPESSRIAVGYGKIQNQRPEAVRILGLSSKDFGKVEWHETKVEDNRMKMKKKEWPLEIASGTTWEFLPEGNHIMFLERSETVKTDQIDFRIQWEGFAEQIIKLKVISP